MNPRPPNAEPLSTAQVRTLLGAIVADEDHGHVEAREVARLTGRAGWAETHERLHQLAEARYLDYHPGRIATMRPTVRRVRFG
jgi:hypothetical protein